MKSFEIAKRDLRACYGDDGIFAGLHHFKDYWARDCMFACFGSLAIGDLDIVKKSLELFLRYSRSGQLPLRIGRRTHEIIFPFNNKRRPIYTTDKNNHVTVDQNSLFLIVLNEYTLKAGNELLEKNTEEIKRIMEWNFKLDKDEDLLIEESLYSNWADSIKKRGKVLYSNVCHIKALKSMIELGFREYLPRYNQSLKKLNELFWAGEHYLDWIDEDRHYNYFSTDGNMLSILWDIADLTKSKHIEEASHIFDMQDIPSRCVHPNYPKNYAYFPLRLIGLGDYHNGLSWVWLGCINAMAKYKIGMVEEAKQLMSKISEIIETHEKVYEVYDKKGRPVRRILYRAEYPFAWSAGMYVYAYREIFGEG